MTGIFAWTAGLRGPEPRKWDAGAPPALGHLRVLARHRISDAEMALTLDELAGRYPAPEATLPAVTP